MALNSSLALDWRLWPEDIEGSAAHARALSARASSPPPSCRPSKRACPVAAEIESGAFVPDDADEDVHMAIERRLTELCGAPGAKLHTARSRNDQVVTDVRLHLRRVIEGQREALRELQELLLARAQPHIESVMPAYTHLQRAQVTSLAQHLLAWFWMLERDRDRFARRARRLPRAAARRRRRGRPELRPRPRRRGRRARLRARLAQLARRRRRPRLRHRLSRRGGRPEQPPQPHRRRDRTVGDRGVRLRRACPTR